MNRRSFLSSAVIATAGLSLPLVSSCSGLLKRRRPNILFIFADDQCSAALGAFGSEVHTPNLDRLVGQGVTFTNAYNMGAWHGAVCVASRTMLVSGRFLNQARNLEPHLDRELEASRLWPQYLAAAGYDTYMAGKWHVKVYARRAFQRTGTIRPGMPSTVEAAYNRPREGVVDTWKAWDEKLGGYWEGGRHWSEVLGDEAETFLQEASGSAHPFFMYLAFNAPHDPRQSPREYVEMYPLSGIKVPENYLPLYPYKDDIGCGPGLRDERLAPFPRTETAVKTHRREYYAIISHMDRQVGRILAALEATGKAQETVILFTADHGLALGQHGLMGKQNMFEHSMKPPLIVSGPGIPGSRVITTPVYLQDIMPTSLELAGLDIPPQVQFRSLLPLIRGRRRRQYEAIYGGYMDLQRMVRKGDYKLIYYPRIDKVLLFDLKRDPLEMHDLAGKAAYGGAVKDLKTSFLNLQKTVDDTLVVPW